ncbi:MAG TPA: hypothetical protein VIW73_05215 [Candidatus Cybelea sp.]
MPQSASTRRSVQASAAEPRHLWKVGAPQGLSAGKHTVRVDFVYDGKMPFKYQGKLSKLLVVLEPEKLDEKDRQRLLEQLAQAAMAVH